MINLAESYLNSIDAARTQAQKEIKESGTSSVDLKDLDLKEKLIRNLYLDKSKGEVSLREGFASTDAIKLVPKIIEGQLREAAEPTYLGANFFKKISLPEGTQGITFMIPTIGDLYAAEVVEGGRYKEQSTTIAGVENSDIEIKTKKIGIKVSITEEALMTSTWDILGLHVKKMGQAMARYKEEWIFNEFSDNAHTLYDNSLRAQFPNAGTTGRDEFGEFNDTLSVEDFLDLALTVMGNGFNPTDVIMHPLTWVVFARNSMIGNGLSFGALGGNDVHFNGQIQGTPGAFGLQANGNGQKMIIKPEQVQNRLPIPLTMNFSPFVRFDKQNKKFDMYCLDREEVGYIVQQEEISTDNWVDPEIDVKNLKCKERYGIGIINNGRAITVAKGLAVAPTYPIPPTINVTNNGN